MRYNITITIGKTNFSHIIDASDEEQAKERLLLRLPPDKRESVKINTISIDQRSIVIEDPYGTFE